MDDRPKTSEGNDKYEFVGNKNWEVYRIRLLKRITLITGEVLEPGTIGGQIEHEGNLSIKGNCWVDENSQVFGKAKVSGDALIADWSTIHGYDVKISDETQVHFSEISGSKKISGKSYIDHCKFYDKEPIKDAKWKDNECIEDNSKKDKS